MAYYLEVLKSLAMQVAAAMPRYVRREEVALLVTAVEEGSPIRPKPWSTALATNGPRVGERRVNGAAYAA